MSSVSATTVAMTGPLQAEILQITSPHCISVRLSDAKDVFCLLQESLSSVYCSDARLQYSLQPGQYPSSGQSYAVSLPGAWYRGLVLHPDQDMTRFKVRLVDAGRVVEVSAAELYTLAPQFLAQNSYSFLVHLSQLSQDSGGDQEVVNYMEELVRDQAVVTLHRRAPPKLVDGHWSLPVEISWTEFEDLDPFLPAVRREVFMSQRLLKNNNSSVKTVSFDFELDDTIEEDIDTPEVPNMKMSGCKKSQPKTTAKPVNPTKTTQFKWTNPELPSRRHFYARATHVDDSGQIYMHLQDQRSGFRALRSEINNQFLKSSPDCALDSFSPNQEVMAQYVDNVWYRARFLGYVPDSEYQNSYVLFVDFGNTSTVPTNLVRIMLVGQDKPIYAFRAVLHNVLSNSLSWAPGTIDFMQDKVMYTQLGGRNQIKVSVESGLDRQPLLVSIMLYSPLDPGDTRSEVFKPWIDLSELLVKKKEARYVGLEQIDSAEQRRSRRPFDYGVGFTVTKRRKVNKEGLERNSTGSVGDSEANVLVSRSSDQIPRLDLTGLQLQPGSVISCRLAAVDTWDRVYLHLVSGEGDQASVGTRSIYSCFTSLDRCMQDMCRDMPPVIRPREGLTVALWRGKDGKGWCRAEVVTCEESGCLVSVVDWGIQEWISDTRLFRELPEQCLGVPVQAVALQLPLVALVEEDTVQALLTECLLSIENSEMKVAVTSCEGQMFGHLVDKENNEVLYRRLEKEKLVRLL
eukprot:GFUD01040969.1.p1 GENE.GFUD01040969.1~~GFUD01040969.1.p1  ORF type:complete len:741 (+),score=250.37 GFUD01040969.1:1340-3562(+)